MYDLECGLTQLEEYVFPDCSFDLQTGKDENPISEVEFVLNIIYISLFQLSEKNSEIIPE